MYIQYTMDQLCLPIDLVDDIPQNHPVRIVNEAVNRLDDNIFSAAYPDGGHVSRCPRDPGRILIIQRTVMICVVISESRFLQLLRVASFVSL